MFLDLHILQNFAPSNLNRDDTNAPKHCDFGGVRRARVSSQSWKRAMRETFTRDNLVGAEDRAVRTKRLLGMLTDRLAAAGRAEEDAAHVARSAVIGLGLGFDAKSPEKTQYLIFLGEREVDGLVAACQEHWDALLLVQPDKKGTKVPPEVERSLGAVINGGRAADVALFGRMIADAPEHNVDAAAQVAHAISTHRVGTEFDFYTAVDDLLPSDTQGADMMGTVEFNSACYYRYACVDTDQLLSNLHGDRELAQAALSAFVRAFISSTPGGKQNTFAAHSRPTLVMAEYRTGGPQSLVDAFARPVNGTVDGGLLGASVRALDDRYGRLEDMYGTDGVVGTWTATTETEALERTKKTQVPGIEQLVAGVVTASPFGGAA